MEAFISVEKQAYKEYVARTEQALITRTKQRDELLKACRLTCMVCFRKTPEACETCVVGKTIAKVEGDKNGT